MAAIFWDFDGTLVKKNQSFYVSLSHALEDCSIPADPQCFKDFLKRSCSWYFPETGYPQQVGDLWWDMLLQKLKKFLEEHGVSGSETAKVCRLFRENAVSFSYEIYEDASAVLARCSEMGIKNYLLSNNFPELKETMHAMNLSRYFEDMFLSSQLGWEKPNQNLFSAALQKADNPETAIMIGDNPDADMKGGKEAGMITILVHGRKSDCSDLCCQNLSEIPDLLLTNHLI